MSREEKEKKKKQKTIIISAMIHGVLLALLIFIFAWKEPDPPIPEYGIELNFGLDAVGSGPEQPQTTTPVESQDTDADEPVEATESSEATEEAADTPEVTTQTTESPHVVKEEPKTEKKQVVKQEEKPKPVEKKVEEKKPVEDPKPTKKTGPESDKDVDATSHGDNTNKEGDKGSPDGKVDERALYGQPGGGGGPFSVNMTGWRPDFEPKPNDTSSESGILVFQITIDESGEIKDIKTVTRGVSAAVERIYREEVQKLTFSKTSDNTKAAPSSTGTITFVLKSQ